MLWQKHWSALLHGTIRIQVPNLQLCWYLFWDFNSWYVCSSWPTYHVFAVTLPSANRLQSKQVDITSAYSHTAKVIETMKAQKSAAKDGVRKVFWQQNWISICVCELWVAKLAEKTSLQAVLTSFFRRTIYIPFLANIASDP